MNLWLIFWLKYYSRKREQTYEQQSQLWTGEMAQWVRLLSLKAKDLSSNPLLPNKTQAQTRMLAPPALGDRHWWMLGTFWSVDLIKTVGFMFSERPYLKNNTRAGEMGQQLRALAALIEDTGLIPRTSMAAHNCP